MAYHSCLIEGLCMLWSKPMCLFHGDLVSIVLEEPVDPGFAWFLLHQIVNQGLQFCMCQWVPHVTVPYAPLNDNCLLWVAEQLLVFQVMSDRCGFATMVAISNSDVGDLECLPSTVE